MIFLQYRRVVAEWMIDVCDYFNLHTTTYHAAIAYLDRLQPNEKFNRQQWQMLAICCIIISAKYNECEEHVPDVATLEEITQQNISNETILNYELWALKRMGWKLNARTPMAFLSCYLAYGVVFPTDQCPLYSNTSDLACAAANDINSLANSAILDPNFKKFLASEVAVAIVACVRRNLGVEPVWTEQLASLTSYPCEVFSGAVCSHVTEICTLLCDLQRCSSPDSAFDTEHSMDIVTLASSSSGQSVARTSPLSVTQLYESPSPRLSDNDDSEDENKMKSSPVVFSKKLRNDENNMYLHERFASSNSGK